MKATSIESIKEVCEQFVVLEQIQDLTLGFLEPLLLFKVKCCLLRIVFLDINASRGQEVTSGKSFLFVENKSHMHMCCFYGPAR